MGKIGLWPKLKAAYRALRRTDDSDRLQSLLGHVPAVIYARTCDAPSKVTYLGGNVQTLLGYEPEEILDNPRFWSDHLHTDDRERYLGTLASLGRVERLEMEYRLRGKNGKWRWLHDECALLRHDDGSSEIVGSCIDVTSRHRSEQALARSEGELRAAQSRLMDALESSDDAFSVFDGQDRLVAFNSRYLSIYPVITDLIRPGIAFEELLRASAQRGQYQDIGPDQVEDWVRERLDRHRHPAGSFEQMLADGRWLEVSEHPTAEGGRVAVRREITARKKIEAAIRDELAFKQSLIDAMPFPMFYKNTDFVYLGCNTAFAEALGKSPDQIVGKTLTETYGEEKAAEFLARDKELFARGGLQDYETDFRWSDGSQRRIAVMKATFTDQNGHVSGLIGSIIDLTAQKRTEEQLVQNARLVTLGQIASEVAHEMNQPLSILRMTAENGLERLEHGEIEVKAVSGKLAIVIEQAGRMAEMISRLRSLARAEDGGAQSFSPLTSIRNAVQLLRPQFQLDDISLGLELPESCANLTGLPGQLEQVILNLLSNARDAVRAYRKPGERRVAVGLWQSDDQLTLTVEDNGGGIPDQLWPRIFSPFFTTKGSSAGTGLGLSISANIIAAMGGRISGHNTGDGALFQIVLPRHGGLAPLLDQPEDAQAPIASSGVKTILVVDDEPLAVDCITDFLTARGHHVIAAITPQDALDLTSNERIDLVLTDQRMPGMDGTVLIRHLRQRWPRLPAIMMSGGTMPLPPPEDGPVARLAKPLILDDLGRIVAEMLSSTPPEANEPAPPSPTDATIPLGPSLEAEPARRLWLIGELTAHLAHDFGQPLNIIRLTAENALDQLAEQQLPEERLRRVLNSTIDQCQRLQQMALAIVTAARKPAQPPRRFQALKSMRDALAGIQDRVRMQAISFSWHAEPHPPRIYGYPERLGTALTKLLDNACDALAAEAMARHNQTPPWQARLVVSCGVDADSRLLLTIADNGPGLAPAVLAALRDGVGKGLGLPIAAGIIAEMNGRLDFRIGPDAPSGIGTEIAITLPPAGQAVCLQGVPAALATDLTALGWHLTTQCHDADAAIIGAGAGDVAAMVELWHAQAPELPIVVIATLDEAQSRRMVGLGAMLVVAADSTAEDLASCLEDALTAQ